MSKESFIGVIVLVGVGFLILIKMWFSPSSMLRPKWPAKQKQVVVQQTETATASAVPTSEPEVENFEVFVSATEYEFNPAVITAKVGQKILLTVHNDGTMKHDFVINVGEQKYGTKLLEPGMSETIEFVANTAGQYTFYCSVPGHREKGMEGILMVEE